MKKTIPILLAFALLLSAAPAFADDIQVVLDGETMSFDVPPTVIDGRTMVPLRAIFEALGATVEYIAEAGAITAVSESRTVSLTVGSKEMYVNGALKELDVPATVVDGRTLVPARAVAEAFKCDVEWDEAARTVYITREPAYDTPSPVIDFSGDSSGAKRNFLNKLRYGFEQTSLPKMLEEDDSLKEMMKHDPIGFLARIDNYAWAKEMDYCLIDYLFRVSDVSEIENLPDRLSAHAYQNYNPQTLILGDDNYCVLLNLADIDVPGISKYIAIVLDPNDNFYYFLLEQSLDGYHMLCSVDIGIEVARDDVFAATGVIVGSVRVHRTHYAVENSKAAFLAAVEDEVKDEIKRRNNNE